VTEEARNSGTFRMIAVGLLLAHELLDAPVPRDLLDAARSAPEIASLASQLCDGLEETTQRPATLHECLSFLARAAERADMRLACRALPLAYFLLYRVVRPGIALLRRALAH